MEQSLLQANPLKQYFRSFKMYLKIPSGTSYYEPNVVEFTDKGEVGVLAMTGKDELALKNPDALLNGEALIEVLTSCVPAVKQPRALLTNDIDALITAIRYATYNDSLETTIKCPQCTHENTYKLDLQHALDQMEQLEPEYVVNLENGLSIFVKPYAFPDLLKGLHAQFEQTKLARAIESDTLSDKQRSDIFGKAFKEIAVTKFELMCGGIVKIVDESNNINVTDKSYIKEFLQNIDKKSVDKIGDQIAKINQIGIKRTFTATCEKCKHEWESEIDFNPVNFS
jgi:DNA-directed RNA polymerase subunit M/transcription elongation factor TFIIS